jgi:hypothetical protein
VKFSKDYVLYCNITTHVETDKDQELLEAKGGDGFPYLIFMDSEGNILAKHEEERDAQGFAKTGEKAKAFLALKAKAAKGDKAAKVDLVIAQLELGHFGAEEAQKKLSGLGTLSKAQKAKLDGLLVAAEIREILKTVTREKDTQREAGKKFLEMKKAGKPAPEGDEAQPYWILILNNAEEDKDVTVFAEALQALKAKYGDNPQAAQFFQAKEAVLKKLREEKK